MIVSRISLLNDFQLSYWNSSLRNMWWKFKITHFEQYTGMLMVSMQRCWHFTIIIIYLSLLIIYLRAINNQFQIRNLVTLLGGNTWRISFGIVWKFFKLWKKYYFICNKKVLCLSQVGHVTKQAIIFYKHFYYIF